MKRVIAFLFLFTAVAFAGKDTFTTLPQQDVNFPGSTINFLRDEPANRLRRMASGFVYSGGLGATSGNLTHTIPALEALVAGYAVKQDATAHTYTALRETFVYAHADDATPATFSVTGGTGCTFQSRNLNLIFVECATGSLQPLPLADALLLFQVTTSGTAITAINDFRLTNPLRNNTVNLRDPLVGAACDDFTDDTTAINLALSIAKAAKRTVEIPSGATCRITSQITIPDGVSIRGENWNTSIFRVVGAVNGFLYSSANTDLPTVEFRNFSVLGDPTQTLVLFTVSGGAWNVSMERVRLRGTSTNALVLSEVPGFTFANGEIGAFGARGIWASQWANGVRILNNRFEDHGKASTLGAISINSPVTSGVWYIRSNIFESNTNQSPYMLVLDNVHTVILEENYVERYCCNYLIINGTTAPVSNVTIRNNYFHSNYPHKIDLAEGAMAHAGIRITENSFAGVSGPSKIFLPGSTTPFVFSQNTSDFETPTSWVDGFANTEKDVTKGKMIFTAGLNVGDWNHIIQHKTSPSDILEIANAIDMAKIHLHVGGTDAVVVEETATTFAGAVTAGTRTFSALATPANGSVVYCSDCTKATPCAGGGTGAIAKRINGVWDCN